MSPEGLSRICSDHDGHRNLDDTLVEQARSGAAWSLWQGERGYAQARSSGSWGQAEVLVHPQWRKQGLGSQLLEAAEQWLLARGVSEVDCWAYGDGKQSVGWLQKRGYQHQRLLYRLERRGLVVTAPELPTNWSMRAFQGEVADWLNLHRRLQLDPRSAWDDARLRQQLNQGSEGFWLLWEGPTLRGYVWLRRQEVFMLGVDPHLVGQGWGHRLLQWAISHHQDELFAYCDDTRLPALRMYSRLGFEEKGRDRCMRRRW